MNYHEQLGTLLAELDAAGVPFEISSGQDCDGEPCEQCGDYTTFKAPGYDVRVEGSCIGGANGHGDTLVEALESILEALKI